MNCNSYITTRVNHQLIISIIATKIKCISNRTASNQLHSQLSQLIIKPVDQLVIILLKVSMDRKCRNLSPQFLVYQLFLGKIKE